MATLITALSFSHSFDASTREMVFLTCAFRHQFISPLLRADIAPIANLHSYGLQYHIFQTDTCDLKQIDAHEKKTFSGTVFNVIAISHMMVALFCCEF